MVASAAVLLTMGLSASSSVGGDSSIDLPVVLDPPTALTEAPAVADWEPVMSALELAETSQLLADHVAAFAHQRAVTDRPVHEPVLETVGRHNTVSNVRSRWGLSVDRLGELNPGLSVPGVAEGTELVVWQYDPERPGRSRQAPNRGRLIDGELMPDDKGWVVRSQRVAFGAQQTIDGLVHALRVVQAQHPGGQDMMIADISRQRGGSFRPHLSHQSGRDVDATYFTNTTEPPVFRRVRAQDLDAARTWTFVRTLLLEHDITYIFMSRQLQIRLFEYAESIGEHPAWLAENFQYGPRRHRNYHGVIRFARGHHDHMHIRFGCTEQDVRCSGTR